MSEKVVFSQLSRKFIDENDATPAEAQQVVYYSLAIGHHLGVIDCLEAALTCPWDEYLAWIATLEAGSEARRKMEGVPKYGEIVIDINHVPMLANAFDKARAAQTSQQKEWSTMLLSMLHDIHQADHKLATCMLQAGNFFPVVHFLHTGSRQCLQMFFFLEKLLDRSI